MFDHNTAVQNIYTFIREEPEAFISCFEDRTLSTKDCFELLAKGDYSQFAAEIRYYFDVNFYDFVGWLSEDDMPAADIQATFALVGIRTKVVTDGEDFEVEMLED